MYPIVSGSRFGLLQAETDCYCLVAHYAVVRSIVKLSDDQKQGSYGLVNFSHSLI